MSAPRASVVIPCYNEGTNIVPCLDRILEATHLDIEVLVVVDFEEDNTVAHVKTYAKKEPRVQVLVSTYGRGPANAIRYGIDNAQAQSVVVTMADGSDDPSLIDRLVLLVERGVVVASASRYSRGGQMVGARTIKAVISRLAGISLQLLTSVGTYDATNSFKAYSRSFINDVGIDSTAGFEIGIELVAKAHRLRLPIAELPTIWLDRTLGESNFKVAAWLPKYLHWYFYAFGPKLSLADVQRRRKGH